MTLDAFTSRLRTLWTDMRSGLWFVPALFVVAAVALALGAIYLETLVPRRVASDWPILFGGGAEGARGTLGAIATSIITVAGVAFSITIVALSLASSQYTPRVLRNFMRDRTNQLVLGVFVGVFAYCLVVLRSIRAGEEDGAFVPSIAVWIAVVFAFVVIGFFIYFIHHIALSIQAAHILSSVARETLQTIDHLFPDALDPDRGDAEEDDEAPPLPAAASWQPVAARRSGYVVRIELDALARLASERNAVIRLDRGVGEFAIEGLPLASVSGAVPTREDEERVVDAYVIDRQRNVDQDPAFGIRQVLDVALKALSPGINDTTTAVMCVDRLTSILSRLAQRRLARPERREQGELRVVGAGPSFAELASVAFGQIRQNAEGNVSVLLHLLWAAEVVSGQTRAPARLRELRRQVEAVAETAERSVPSPIDRQLVAARAARVRQLLESR